MSEIKAVQRRVRKRPKFGRTKHLARGHHRRRRAMTRVLLILAIIGVEAGGALWAWGILR